MFTAGFSYQDPVEDVRDGNGPRKRVPREQRASARYRAEDARLFIKAWKRFPESVKKVVAIVDNPRSDPDGAQCIRRSLKKRIDPGRACSVARSWALKPDAAAQAARLIDSPKGEVIDVSDAFCDQRRCFPVIGNALVYAEGNHQTPVFNRTLTPWLAEAIDRIAPGR